MITNLVIEIKAVNIHDALKDAQARLGHVAAIVQIGGKPKDYCGLNIYYAFYDARDARIYLSNK